MSRFLILTAIILCALCSPASAQQRNSSAQRIDWPASVAATGLVSTATGIVAIFYIPGGLSVFASTFRVTELTSEVTDATTTKCSFRGPCLNSAYIQAHGPELYQDINLGAGPHLRDVAALHGLQKHHVPAFARLLRTQRASFRPLAQRDTTQAQFFAMGYRIDQLAIQAAGQAQSP